MHLFLRWSCALFLLLALAAHAQDPAQFARDYSVPLQRAEAPIEIDGVLDDAPWQTDRFVTGFQQNFPFDTAAMVGETRVWVAYDAKYLYIAAECLHAVEGRYVVESLQRDYGRFRIDYFSVVIDPANDQTNGFYFALSPYGVQAEGLISLTDNVELNWDNKWYGEAKRHGDKWTCEFAIPFRTLRYPEDNPLWRMNFTRGERRVDNQVGSWVPIPVNQNVDNLLFTGALNWPELPPKPGKNFALIPYALVDGARDYQNNVPWETSNAFGLDAKVAVTPSLNLDLTVNPDFSTVDADVQQINLTRFALFFPERRQFFLENADLFGTFGFESVRPFFSRRIGLGIPIVGGARLSGKIGTQWRVGLLNIQTEGLSSEDDEGNAERLLPQNYTVAAIQRQVFKTSNIAAIFVNRQGFDDTGQGFLWNDYNRVAGLDFNYNSPNSKWSGEAFYHHSFSPNNLEKPYATGWRFEYNDRNWELGTNGEHVSQNYDPETGFVPRQQQRDGDGNLVRLTYTRSTLRLGYTFLPENSKVLQHGPNFFGLVQLDSAGRPTDLETNFWWSFTFDGFKQLEVRYEGSFTRLLFPFDGLSDDDDAQPLAVGSYRWSRYSVEYNSDRRKLLRWGAEISGGTFYTSQAYTVDTEIIYQAQPWGVFTLNVEYNRLELPAENGGEEEFLLIGPQVNVSFTRSLFFRTFLQYNSQENNMNINTRVQWRYRPLSDLFFVYIDNYDQFLNIRNRALVLKAVFWLSS